MVSHAGHLWPRKVMCRLFFLLPLDSTLQKSAISKILRQYPEVRVFSRGDSPMVLFVWAPMVHFVRHHP